MATANTANPRCATHGSILLAQPAQLPPRHPTSAVSLFRQDYGQRGSSLLCLPLSVVFIRVEERGATSSPRSRRPPPPYVMGLRLCGFYGRFAGSSTEAGVLSLSLSLSLACLLALSFARARGRGKIPCPLFVLFFHTVKEKAQRSQLIFNLYLMPPSLDGNWKSFVGFFLNFNLVVVPCSFLCRSF